MYTIGSNKDKLIDLASKHGVLSQKCLNLSDAIREIHLQLQTDEVALLSPAAASLDEFSSYAQRGNEFKEAVLELV